MADLSSNGNGPSITADEALESVREAWQKTYGAASYSSSTRNPQTHDRFGHGSPDAEEREQMQLEMRERIQKGQRYDHRPVYEIFEEVAETARQSIRQSLAGSERIGDVVRPKLTIDLSRQFLEVIPEEVVEILKDDVERLVLSHNYIWHLPLKFSECTPLKYLNLRANKFKEIPKAVWKLPQLEILDMGRNKIVTIPEEVMTMKALRVLSLMNNRIENLPVCIGSLDTLRILKLAGNLLPDGLKRIVEGNGGSPSPTAAIVTDNERDVLRTRKLKKYLKAEAAIRESGGDSSDGPLDTPRPLKRNLSVRFPVVPAASGSESASDVRSPAYVRSPALSRSHVRTPSSQNTPFYNAALRRPGIAPLTLGTDRNRSNSASVLQATRNKRMGIVPRKSSDLSTLDEARPRRLSHHFRGESYGSVLRDRNRSGPRNVAGFISNPATPAEVEHQPGTSVRRLSSLSENKRESNLSDKIAECASGILFSLDLLALKVPELLDGSTERNAMELNLPGVYHYASNTLKTLYEGLRRYEQTARGKKVDERVSRKEIRAACKNSIVAYLKLGKVLLSQRPRLIADADHRYVRNLVFMVHQSLVELRNAYQRLDLKPSKKVKHTCPGVQEDNLQDRNLPLSATPTRYRQKLLRLRTGTALQNSNNVNHFPSPPEPSPSVTPYIVGRSRSNSQKTNMGNCFHPITGTPRNQNVVAGGPRDENIQPEPAPSVQPAPSTQAAPGTEATRPLRSRADVAAPNQTLNGGLPSSFTATLLVQVRSNSATPINQVQRQNVPHPPISPSTRTHGNISSDAGRLERQARFGRVLGLIMTAVEQAIGCIPRIKADFTTWLQAAFEAPGMHRNITSSWSRLVLSCTRALETAHILHQFISGLTAISLDDQTFWDLCIKFVTHITMLLRDMRFPIARGYINAAFVDSVRPMRVTCRDALCSIRQSPWQALAANVPRPVTSQSLMQHSYMEHPNDPTRMIRILPPQIQPNATVTQINRTPPSGMYAGNTAPLRSTNVQPLGAHPTNTYHSTIPTTSASSTSVPATPLSAALGPAAQATIPAAQGFETAFHGNFFQRVDALRSGQQTRFTGVVRRGQ